MLTEADTCRRYILPKLFSAGWKGTRDIAGRFIRAGLTAPRQLILDQGKDLNEFYQLAKGR